MSRSFSIRPPTHPFPQTQRQLVLHSVWVPGLVTEKQLLLSFYWPFCGAHQGTQDIDSRGFAGAVRSKEAKYLPLLHLKAYIIHRSQVAEFLYQVLHLDNACHIMPFVNINRRIITVTAGFFNQDLLVHTIDHDNFIP